MRMSRSFVTASLAELYARRDRSFRRRKFLIRLGITVYFGILVPLDIYIIWASL